MGLLPLKCSYLYRCFMINNNFPDNHENVFSGDTLFENSITPMMLMDSERKIIKCNKRFYQMFNYEPSEIIGEKTSILTPTLEHFEEYKKYFKETFEGFFNTRELLYKKKDGELFWVKIHGMPISNQLGNFILWSFDDVRKEIEYRNRQMAVIFDKVNVGFALVVNKKVENANQIFTHYLGIEREDIIGKNIEIFLNCFSKCKEENTKKIKQFRSEDKGDIFCEMEIVEVTTESHIIILDDITEHVQEKTKLTYLSQTDDLTKTYNRRAFFQKAQKIMDDKTLESLSFLMFDIDLFKKINDTYGHDIGDDVLVELCGLVKNQLRKGEILGRLGGEEFGIMLPVNKNDATDIAERILKKIQSHKFTRLNLNLTVSMGICDTSKSLLMENIYRLADQMLYRAKYEGRNRIVVDI